MLKTKKAAQRAANNLTCRSQNNIFFKENTPKVVQWAAYNLPAAQTSSNSIQIKKTSNTKNRSQTKQLANAQPQYCRKNGHKRLSQIIYISQTPHKEETPKLFDRTGPKPQNKSNTS